MPEPLKYAKEGLIGNIFRPHFLLRAGLKINVTKNLTINMFYSALSNEYIITTL